ncbi:MAG TPA: DUF1302 family protein [Nevskiaceae bacterium]|nr:DUF1302 family protein [Nevskiaceae bacterium]
MDHDRRSMRAALRACLILFCAALALPAQAGTVDLGNEVELEYKLSVSYALAMRTRNADARLTDAPVEEFQSYLIDLNVGPGQPSQLFRFERQGLSQSMNSDDGDRNFKKWALIHDRLSGLGELQLHWKDYGAVLSGSAFYDDVYHHHNDNDSAATLNLLGPNGEYPDPQPTRFTSATKKYDGARARLLESYVYGSWWLGDESNLNLRFGRQLVAYGESLFFSGIASAMGPADATKAFVPGAEIKDILLPVNQVSLNLAINNDLSLLGSYKLEFHPTEIFPQGDYLSPSDVVGPGAYLVYGSANPLGGVSGCSGLLQNFHVLGLPVGVTPAAVETALCGLLGLAGQTLLNAPPYIYNFRGPDITPGAHGQYAVGLKYQVTSASNLGLYYLRYHDTNPSVQLSVGYPVIGTIGGRPITTQVLNQATPVGYNVKYFDGIHLAGLTFSTVLGGFNVAGELNYRDGVDTPVETIISGHVSPVFQRGRISQALVSALYVTNPDLFFDDLVLVNEAQFLHVNGVDRLAPSLGIAPVGNGDTLFYDRDAYGFMSLVTPTRHNLFSGWDLSVPIAFGWLIKGTPAMAGAFGPLYGEGDMRASLGLDLQYLQNLQFSAGYNWFFGDPAKTIKDSTLAANPYADRDYATLSVKYNF